MDFVTGLPKTLPNNNAVWVIVDRLMKSTHYLSFRVGLPLKRLVGLYIEQIVRLHGVLVTIVSDQDSRFVSQF